MGAIRGWNLNSVRFSPPTWPNIEVGHGANGGRLIVAAILRHQDLKGRLWLEITIL